VLSCVDAACITIYFLSPPGSNIFFQKLLPFLDGLIYNNNAVAHRAARRPVFNIVGTRNLGGVGVPHVVIKSLQLALSDFSFMRWWLLA
jgi:hypothetical protein